MEVASPARLYASVAGVLLVVIGLLGFFCDASFDQVDRYEEALGALQVNGWLNLFYVVLGAIGVLAASAASRAYALTAGVLFTLLAIVGWGTGTLHLVIGLLGLAAAAGTPGERAARRKPRLRRSEPRAQRARKRA